MASTYLDLRAITNLSGRKIRVMTDKSVIAYPSVWPLARGAILVRICFPPIPWPMTPPQMFPQIWESWLKSGLIYASKLCHHTMVEVVEPFKLYPTSNSYTWKVFDLFQLLWMDIWLHHHTVTTTDASPDLEELVEILGDESEQTMPPHYG